MDNNLDDLKQIDRLIDFLSTKGAKSYTSVENLLTLGRGHITKSKQRDGFVGGGVLKKVAIMFPDLNLRWLLTGEGNMHVEAVRRGLSNESNQDQELINVYRQLTKTQSELQDCRKEKDELIAQKTVPVVSSVSKLKGK